VLTLAFGEAIPAHNGTPLGANLSRAEARAARLAAAAGNATAEADDGGGAMAAG
jgi:hypothetical protein